MAGSDSTEMHFRCQFQLFTDLNALTIVVANLNIQNSHLWPVLSNLRFPFAQRRSSPTIVANEFLMCDRGRQVKTFGVFLHHPMRIKDRSDTADRLSHSLQPRHRKFAVRLRVIKWNDLV